MKKIITIAAMAFACGRLPAAKMCVSPMPSFSDAGTNWAAGIGCGGHGSSSTTCQTILMQGQSAQTGGTACNDGDEVVTLPTSTTSTDSFNYYWCKRTLPVESNWVCSGRWNNTSGPNHVCGTLTGMASRPTEFTKSRAKLLTIFY